MVAASAAQQLRSFLPCLHQLHKVRPPHSFRLTSSTPLSGRTHILDYLSLTLRLMNFALIQTLFAGAQHYVTAGRRNTCCKIHHLSRLGLILTLSCPGLDVTALSVHCELVGPVAHPSSYSSLFVPSTHVCHHILYSNIFVMIFDSSPNKRKVIKICN